MARRTALVADEAAVLKLHAVTVQRPCAVAIALVKKGLLDLGSGRYGNSSDVIRDLIRREQVKAEKIANMQRLVDEGRASGTSDRTPREIIEAARTEFRKRA